MNMRYLLFALLLVVSVATAGKPVGSPAIQTGKGHRFACADYSGKKVYVVNEAGKVEWEYPTGNCNDLWVLPNGNLLFSTGRTVVEVNAQKEIIFEYKSKGEVYACQRLPNGNTFVGECSLARLLEVAPDGSIVKQIELEAQAKGKSAAHSYMRNARVLENGNYLVCHYGEGVVREYDSSGGMVREIQAPSGPHSAVRLANGNTIISEGDRKKKPRIWEVDSSGHTVWSVERDELPGIQLKFMTGFQRLSNGNTVMCNWVGHKQFGKAPHIIEVTKDKRVVWTYEDHDAMRAVANICLMDDPGDTTQFEVMH